MIEEIIQIKNMLNREELLAQLAEDSAALSQAALQLRRVVNGTNPTPITYGEAEASLEEEAADVSLVLLCLGISTSHVRSRIIQKEAAERWVKRLSERQCKANE